MPEIDLDMVVGVLAVSASFGSAVVLVAFALGEMFVSGGQ